MQSQAKTVAEYLKTLPEDRRKAMSAVRDVFRANLGAGYEEGMGYGMIRYHVPHSVYPKGYHCDPQQPLPFACLASQKNHMAVYLMSVYLSPEREAAFRAAWAKSGKKLDMGKSCVRFKKLEDVALDVLAEVIRGSPVKHYIAQVEAVVARGAKPARTATKKSAPARKPAKSIRK